MVGTIGQRCDHFLSDIFIQLSINDDRIWQFERYRLAALKLRNDDNSIRECSHKLCVLFSDQIRRSVAAKKHRLPDARRIEPGELRGITCLGCDTETKRNNRRTRPAPERQINTVAQDCNDSLLIGPFV